MIARIARRVWCVPAGQWRCCARRAWQAWPPQPPAESSAMPMQLLSPSPPSPTLHYPCLPTPQVSLDPRFTLFCFLSSISPGTQLCCAMGLACSVNKLSSRLAHNCLVWCLFCLTSCLYADLDVCVHQVLRVACSLCHGWPLHLNTCGFFHCNFVMNGSSTQKQKKRTSLVNWLGLLFWGPQSTQHSHPTPVCSAAGHDTLGNVPVSKCQDAVHIVLPCQQSQLVYCTCHHRTRFIAISTGNLHDS